MKTNEEKLQKVISDIEKENNTIKKSKEKIKKLRKSKNQIEFAIEKEKNKKLFEYLSDFGIKSVEDFQQLLNKDDIQQTQNENE